MINQHPITPPSEMMDQWCMDFYELGSWRDIATKAAQWGADQELEACLKALDAVWDDPANSTVEELQRAILAARRPKSPSLKKQALHDLEALEKDLKRNGMGFGAATIRRALEQL
jgi:hypothetical protein